MLGFRLSAYPLQFLILAAAIMATARFRLMGAGVALIVITAIALGSPNPFMTASHMARVELLQLFLAITSIVCVRVAMVLNQRDLHMAVIERRRRQAVRASRFKSQLLSHVSHEVRSPLSAIIGFSGMLESGTLPLERAHEFAHVIGHNGELLQRLHDDLLDLSRAEAGALSVLSERVPVQATLKTCISALKLESQLGGKPVLLDEMEESLAVSADPLRLAQIINNLIANAYKYGAISRLSMCAPRPGQTALAASKSPMPGRASGRMNARPCSVPLAGWTMRGAMCRARAWAFPSPRC